MTISRKTTNEITALAKRVNRSNKKQILVELDELLKSKNFSDSTLRVSYSDARKIFSTYSKDKKFLKKIKASDELTETVNATTRENRGSRTNLIISHDDLVKLGELRDSENIYDRAIYLLFASGRRTIELLSSNFKKNGDRIKVDGLVKRSKFERTDEECNIQTVIPENEFLKMVGVFQDDVERQAIKSTSFSRTLNRRIRRLLGDQWKPHSLRGAYALYLYKFQNPDDQNRNGFIRKVLCHQSDNSSLSYVAFELTDDVTGNEFGKTAVPKKIKEVEESEEEEEESEEEEEESEEEEEESEEEVEKIKDLSAMTVKQLRVLAKVMGLKRYSNAPKQVLIDMILK